MATIDLKGLHCVRSKGRVYVYAWRGGPRIPGEIGSKEFLDALAELKGRPEDSTRLAGLVIAYKASDAFTGLADTTRRSWSPWLDRIRDDLGRLSIKTFDRPEVRQVIKKWRGKWKYSPRVADTGKQVLSAVLSYAVEEGKLGTNPCFGISNLYSNNRADVIWEAADIARWLAKCSPEVGFALRLACLTGLRRGDLLRLRWDHVGPLAIVMPTGKSSGKLEYVVPLYGELRDLLAEIRAYWSTKAVVPLTILAGERGRAWTPNGFGSVWNDVRAEVGEETLHFHDTRGTAATKFALAGFTDEDIAEIVGWEVSRVKRIIDRYVRRAARLKAKIEKMDGAGAAG